MPLQAFLELALTLCQQRNRTILSIIRFQDDAFNRLNLKSMIVILRNFTARNGFDRHNFNLSFDPAMRSLYPVPLVQ